ncbi:MAG: transcription antitermination factor NusB [Acutalibacteraceae bacterium]
MADKKLTPREQAFIVVFEKSFNPDMTVDEIVASAGEGETVRISEKAAAMCREIETNLDSIDSVVESHLRGWSKSRISKVALAALRLGVYELKFSDAKAPVGVIISEAVGISKTYGSDEDKSFVNGVLGAVSRAHE